MRRLGMMPILFLIGLLMASFAAADPFTQAKGSSTLTFFVTNWEVDSFYSSLENEVPLPGEIDQSDFFVSLDHGLTDKLTLSITLPWSSSERDFLTTEEFANNDGFSDARIGLKYRLTALDNPNAFSVLFGFKWAGDYESNVINSPGDGQTDFEVLLSWGRQGNKGSISVDGGYRSRSGIPEDEIVFRVDGSWLLSQRFGLFGSLEMVDQDGGTEFLTPELFPPGTFPILGVDYDPLEEDFQKAALGAFVAFSERYSAFVAVSEVLDGKATAAGNQYGLGFSLAF